MVKSLNKSQFGDFQTPDSLAQEITQLLSQNHHVFPQVVLEPSCGKGAFILNGMGEKYCLENHYLYPLLKSSAMSQGRTDQCHRFVLVTQKFVGEDTRCIQTLAPQTWQYLVEHDRYFQNRRSRIYQNKPPYSIFGIGSYAFKSWKIAISGLYKKLSFCLIKPIDGKPVMFDDTVNFLSFDAEEEAQFILALLTSTPALEFLDSMIFWDNKRPITIDILRRLSLKNISKDLSILETYLRWSESV